jgi:RNA polymerase sigma-70 factor (ECF subfamily)
MDTEDLVQECVLRTIEDYNKVRDRERLLSFMIGVANNVCNNQIRLHIKQRTYSEEEARSLLTRPQNADSLTDIGILYECLHSLPNRQREAIIMFEITGFSMKEIAVILDSSEGAIKTLVSRGRDKLKEMMAVTIGTV